MVILGGMSPVLVGHGQVPSALRAVVRLEGVAHPRNSPQVYRADSLSGRHLFLSHTSTHRPFPVTPLHADIWDLCQYPKRNVGKTQLWFLPPPPWYALFWAMRREQEREEVGRDQQRQCILCHQILGSVIAMDFIITRQIHILCRRLEWCITQNMENSVSRSWKEADWKWSPCSQNWLQWNLF